MELSKQEMEFFSHSQASDQKTSFPKCFSFGPRGLKLTFEAGNAIIQTKNGIIPPTSKLLIKKLLFPILNKVSGEGVNMREGKLVRYK